MTEGSRHPTPGLELARIRLEAQQAILGVLAESATIAAAGPGLLRVLCESARYDFGAVWRLDSRSPVLHCVETWCAPGSALAAFTACTRAATHAAGEELPGRIWKSGKPAWVVDFGSEAQTPRATLAVQQGLRGAVAFPIFFGERFFGVLEFCSRTAGVPDPDWVRLLDDINRQIASGLSANPS